VLRAIREQQGLTQRQVSERLGKREGSYAAYENGRSRFTLPELPEVADALRVSTAHLAGRLGFCGDGGDLAQTLVERFGPELGRTLARLDRVLARMQQDDALALNVTVRRHVEPYESRT
jgi:transcriptional regulator with XRE-family HTH domain